MIRAGIAILFLSWMPLLVAGFVFGQDNPVGLGLLALAGSAVGVGLAGLGLVRWVARRRRAPSSGNPFLVVVACTFVKVSP